MEPIIQDTSDERFTIWPLQILNIPSHHLSAKSKEDLNIIQSKYEFYRRVKGDGNCFYRSIMYSYLEFLILLKPKYLSSFCTL